MRSGAAERRQEQQRPLPVVEVEQIQPRRLFPLGLLWEGRR